MCRSPLAEALWRAKGYEASSAGISARKGTGIHPLTLAALGRRGIEADPAFEATLVTPRLLGEPDVVLCMERAHRGAITAMQPRAASKTFVLNEFEAILAEHPGITPREAHRLRRGYDLPDIADPVNGTASDFNACAEELNRLLNSIALNAEIKGD